MTTNAFSISPCGDDLLCIESRDKNAPLLQSLAIALRETGDWLEVVPGMSGVVVQFDNLRWCLSEAQAKLAVHLRDIPNPTTISQDSIEVPICYEGAYGLDLSMLEDRLELSAEQIVSRHLSRTYRIQMIGFLPGFAYCGALDQSLETARLASPRTRVAAGSVGITGRQTGIYSLDCPGGWPIIGRTPLKLFDAGRSNPFLLAAGMEVSFRQVTSDEFKALYRKYHQ